MKEKILKNCKKYWYVIAFIIVGFIVLNKEPDYLVLKKNTFKVELGTPFNIKPETYLNTEKLDTDVKKDVLENAKVTVDKDSAIDVNTIGAYTLKIISEDNYGNKCDKGVAINVVAPLSADEVIVEETVSNADGTTTTKIVTRKKTEAQSGDFRIVTSGDTSKSSNNSSYSSSSSSSNSISTIKPSGST